LGSVDVKADAASPAGLVIVDNSGPFMAVDKPPLTVDVIVVRTGDSLTVEVMVVR